MPTSQAYSNNSNIFTMPLNNSNTITLADNSNVLLERRLSLMNDKIIDTYKMEILELKHSLTDSEIQIAMLYSRLNGYENEIKELRKICARTNTALNNIIAQKQLEDFNNSLPKKEI